MAIIPLVAMLKKRLANTGAVVYEEDGQCKVRTTVGAQSAVVASLPAGMESEIENVDGGVIIEVSGVKNLRG